jgi:hypothetical protein
MTMNDRGGMKTSLVATLITLSLGIATHAAAQDVPPPPPAAPAPAPVIVVAPQQPPPQTVYVQQQAPQYGTAVYTQPGYAEPAPQRRGPNLGLVIGGAVMLGVGWVCNLVGSLFAGVHVDLFGSGGGSDAEWAAFRYTGIVPVLGPWIQLAVQPTSFGNDGWGTWLILDGLLQAAGFTMLIVGVVTMNGGDDQATAEGDDDFQIAILPSVGHDHAGLTAVGRF